MSTFEKEGVKMRRQGKKILALLLPLLLLTALPRAKAQTATGTITGIVTDATGAVVAGATVTIREVKTNLSYTITTDSTGLYRLTNLPRGFYEVKVEQTGFKTAIVSNIELTVNEVKRVDVTLEVGEIAETITVTGELPLINTEEGRLSGLVDKRRIVDLPLVTRDFTQLALLQPGVVPGGVGSNTGGFSIGGARSRGTNFLVDGIENNDPVVAGFTQITVPLDSVEEFRLIRNTFGAEFGRLSGGVLSIVTKSGTNEFHGTLWEFHRNRSLRARDFFEREKPPFVRNQFGFDVSGPLIKDTLFGYGSYEVTTLRSSTTQRARFFTADAIRAATGPIARELLQKYPRPAATENPRFVTVGNEQIPVSAETVITRPSSSDVHAFVIRMDHQGFNGRNRISGRYIFNQTNDLAPLASNSLLTEFFGLDTSFRSQNVGLTNTTTIRPNLINELKLGLTRDAYDWRPRNPQVPTITITGVNGFGAATNMPQNRFPVVFQLDEALSIIKGTHAVKTGFQYRFIKRVRTFNAFYRGAYSFANEAAFLADQPLTYSVRIDLTTGDRGDGYRIYSRHELMGFLQDDWKVRPNFTLNVGVRYENFRPPKELTNRIAQVLIPSGATIYDIFSRLEPRPTRFFYHSDDNNFAPRLGFAWSPRGPRWLTGGEGKMAIRGSYGVFYERLFQNIDENIQFNPPFGATLTFDTRARQTFVYSIPSWVPPGLKGAAPPRGTALNPVFDPNLRTSYMQSWFFGIQRELPGEFSFEITYQGTKGTKLPLNLNINRFDGDLLDGVLDRVNPQWGAVGLAGNRVNSIYHAMQVEVKRRFSRGFTMQTAWTVSKMIDEDSDYFASDGIVSVTSIKRERGLSRFHVPQRLVINAIWDMPFFRGRGGALEHILGGWTISGIATFQSGRPFNVSSSAPYPRGDFNADGVNNDRPNIKTDKKGARLDRSPADGILDPNAFDTNFRGIGNLGRNVFLGPGYANFDFAVYKNFRLAVLGEQGRLQFRAEMFNLPNHTNFDLPVGDLANSLFGKSNATFDSRRFQLALKLYF
jgi:hypothetical protein